MTKNHNLVTGFFLSQQLTNALGKLELIFRDDLVNKKYYKYDSLISAVVPTLNADLDKKVFVSATSIAQYSTAYWEVNKAKWDSIIFNNISLSDASSSQTLVNASTGKSIVYADIAGGVTGLIRGAVVGGTGGTVAVPGVGTVAGAAAGGIVGGAVGAVAGSAAEGIHTLIKWAIDW